MRRSFAPCCWNISMRASMTVLGLKYRAVEKEWLVFYAKNLQCKAVLGREHPGLMRWIFARNHAPCVGFTCSCWQMKSNELPQCYGLPLTHPLPQTEKESLSNACMAECERRTSVVETATITFCNSTLWRFIVVNPDTPGVIACRN